MAGENGIVIAGYGGGSDTTVVAIAALPNHITDAHITEIICKLLQTKPTDPPQWVDENPPLK